MGVIAIAVFANSIGGGPAAVGVVMTARVLPGFIVGPLAGVIADRWDRKKTMVIADILRALIIFSLPFVPNLVYLLVASVALESLTLVWGPAKDAALPHFVSPKQLTHANSLSLIAIYGAWPLASVAYAALTTIGRFFGTNVPVLEGLQDDPEALALWVDSLTFVFSAIMVSSLAIRTSKTRAVRLDLSQIKGDLMEGLVFVRDHEQVRPWLLGIAFTFMAAGAVFSLGVDFVDKVLGGGDRGFAFLIGFLATGMIIGLLAVGAMARRIQRDVLFSSSILLLGVGLIALASMSSLNRAIPIASALGFFAGTAYSTGYTLMQATTEDELRGRTFGAAYTIIRIGTLVGLGLFPFLAGAIGDHVVDLPFGRLDIPGTRATLWSAGLVAIFGSVVSMRAIGARGRDPAARPPGRLIVFEGGEAAGKSTQIEAFVQWLRVRGTDVVRTREPGGTDIGSRIRDVLLDPAAQKMDPRTEALLYAADRAQHVAEVVRPALAAGALVVSDRFLDSSLAYQGLARGLGLDEIYRLSEWATGGIIPDLVFFLSLDAEKALARLPDERDRIEGETNAFHESVVEAYLDLARRFPDRFVVIDAARATADIHREIVAEYVRRLGGETAGAVRAGAEARPRPGPR